MAYNKLVLFTSLLAFFTVSTFAGKSAVRSPLQELSPSTIDAQLQTCPIVKALNAQKQLDQGESSSLITQLFAILFPGSAAVNSLLATLYISGPPNFLLALCPPNIDPSSLNTMVAFAVGGLLGDVLFHLLPEVFLGEDPPDHVRFVMVEPNRNLVLGVAIMIGFVTFMAMEKGLKIATGGEGHDHSHGHPAEHSSSSNGNIASATGLTQDKEVSGLQQRKGKKASDVKEVAQPLSKDSTQLRMRGYLNMFADFTHNITDGLALSSSFYASTAVGATTCVAVFFHEIPHEVGDFALLIQSGFTKRRAMAAQFVTASGALIGTILGICVQEYGGPAVDEAGVAAGVFGTSLSWGDMLLPWTAGTFLYVGTVAVIPDLLETTGDTATELKRTVIQFIAMAVGAGIMLAISWS